MADVINSAYDAIGELPVAEIIEAPELFEKALEELLEGEQAYKVLFDTYDTPEEVVAYRHDVAPELDDKLKELAEFEEIPVSDPLSGDADKYKKIGKYGIGLRVSEEQRRRDKRKQVQQEILARARTIRMDNGAAALAALAAAPIEEFPVDVAWDVATADVREDIGLVTDLILGATDENGRKFNYEPNFLWASPVTINRIKRNKSITDSFVGDMAAENPLFKKIARQPLLGDYLQMVPDMSLPDGEAYIGVEQVAGYVAQNGAPETTAFYEEHGQSGIGGATMSWRSDYVHFRGLFVKAPKSIVKLTGLVTPIAGG